MEYRDRIVGTVRIWGDRADHHPKNWRVHGDFQRSVLTGSLEGIGIAGSAKAVPADPTLRAEVFALKTRKDRDAWAKKFEAGKGRILILDGHLRETVIRDQPAPYELLDLNEEEQAQFIATFDPIGDLATMDRAKFLDLAHDFNSTSPEVQKMVADLAAVDAGGEGGATNLGDPDGKEFDETIANDVETVACPNCGHKFPRGK